MIPSLPFTSPINAFGELSQAHKVSVLSAFLLFAATAATHAQAPPPNQNPSNFITVPAVGKFLQWYGYAQRTYFVQVSDANSPLAKWNCVPIIETGNNANISYEVDGTAPRNFFRLESTDQLIPAGETPETADFDHDGRSNINEISPPPPLTAAAATDPLDGDTDHDGLLDGFELAYGFDPNNPDEDENNVLDGADDSDDDGWSNAAEADAGTNPNDPNDNPDTPAEPWVSVSGDAEGVPVIQTRTFTIKKGQSRILVIGTTSLEYPRYTGYASEWDDLLEWEITPSSGDTINGSLNVNDRHEDWEIDEINEVTLHGFGPSPPVHIETVKVIQAPANTDVTVTVKLTATNISDDILPSTVIVGLVPLEFVDKVEAPLAELKVGKMYPTVLWGNGLNGDPVVVNLDGDEDRFFVRVKDAAFFGTIKMKFETVDNAVATYNDDPTEYTLKSIDGYATTKSMVLVSDDVDDNHLASTGGDPDNSPNDQTHKIQLGGNFKISAIKLGERSWDPVDIKLPVKKKKTVRVQFVNCTYGVFDIDPCWTPGLIELAQKTMRERYAQVGVDFDFPAVLAGPFVSRTGSMDDDEIFSLPSGTGKMVFPQEAKDLVDHGPPNDFTNTLMIYLVFDLDSFSGVASPPKYVNAADVRFQNKVILEQAGFLDFTSSHEALHVLTDAAHDVPTHLDFDTEFGNSNTIWTIPSVAAQRDNGSIGSTKRISLPQEDKIHSSPLSK